MSLPASLLSVTQVTPCTW